MIFRKGGRRRRKAAQSSSCSAEGKMVPMVLGSDQRNRDGPIAKHGERFGVTIEHKERAGGWGRTEGHQTNPKSNVKPLPQ